MTINLFIMDIHSANNTNGVDRHVRTLLSGLQKHSNIRLHWIHLVNDRNMLCHKVEEMGYYLKVSIPVPLNNQEMYSEQYWMKRYNELIYKYLRPHLEDKENCILHLHTLNLIDLALFIKQYHICHIVTHLHCLPWKGIYNLNQKLFNQMYRLCYSKDGSPDFSHKILCQNRFELDSYNCADHVICVTHCAETFLKSQMSNPEKRVSVVPNGIDDILQGKNLQIKKTVAKDKTLQCLHVGVVSESKGLRFILKALSRLARSGRHTELTVAGSCSPGMENYYRLRHPELKLNFLGCIPFDELKALYLNSDVGLIASVQEQASYVAVEMAMFGLPVVTTAVDGLDELFTDNLNALKVNTRFSPVFGLSADDEMMAEKIGLLIDNPQLRKSLAVNIRKLYENKLRLDQMIGQIVHVYEKVLN
jgi:glycosyltransferase involved in cell wall biosynthesis